MRDISQIEFVQIQAKLVPEIIEITEKRYSILKTIDHNQPVGRRALANLLDKSERWVRSELEILKDQKLIEILPLGMIVTEDGKEVINKLKGYIEELKGLKDMQHAIKAALGVKDVIIVPGDLESDHHVLHELADAAFEYLKSVIVDNTIIAVSGGMSVLTVAEHAYKLSARDIVVVPARGGIRADFERQANIVAAKLGKNIGGDYYLLHLPDNIDEPTLAKMAEDPDISKVIGYIRKADIFIFGLSSLEAISLKRNYSVEEMNYLKSLEIKAEAFGCYFNSQGSIVHRTGSIGIKPEDLKHVKTSMAVGGGASKAEAIVLVNKGRSNNVIVTDEAAAQEIYQLIQGGI